MNKVIVSNGIGFKEGDVLGIGSFSFNPLASIRIGKSKKKSFVISESKIEVLDEESAKNFLGSAGLGLVGGALLGPVGLVAGALAGGNKKSVVFGIEDKNNRKVVVEVTGKKDIKILKEQAMKSAYLNNA